MPSFLIKMFGGSENVLKLPIWKKYVGQDIKKYKDITVFSVEGDCENLEGDSYFQVRKMKDEDYQYWSLPFQEYAMLEASFKDISPRPIEVVDCGEDQYIETEEIPNAWPLRQWLLTYPPQAVVDELFLLLVQKMFKLNASLNIVHGDLNVFNVLVQGSPKTFEDVFITDYERSFDASFGYGGLIDGLKMETSLWEDFGNKVHVESFRKAWNYIYGSFLAENGKDAKLNDYYEEDGSAKSKKNKIIWKD
jgi:hypothetical protein